jgi:hypothetical protein
VVGEGDGFGELTEFAAGLGIGDLDGTGNEEGVEGNFLTVTPTFQTSLPFTFMQVNFFPRAIEVFPNFGQLEPALTTASEDGGTSAINKIIKVAVMLDRPLTSAFY